MSKAILRTDDSSEIDITNAVTILWDGVVASLDWGSGWWTGEDAGAVAWIGQLMGFKLGDEVHDFAEEIAAYERRRAMIDANLPELP